MFDVLESKVKNPVLNFEDPDICDQLEEAFTIARSEIQKEKVPTKAITDIRPCDVIKIFGLRVNQNPGCCLASGRR